MAASKYDLVVLGGGPAGEKGACQAGYLAFVAIIGLLGAMAMAANQAMVAIEAVCFLSADGFAIAAGAIVAQKLGAGRAADASRAGLLAAGMAVAMLLGLIVTALRVPAGKPPEAPITNTSP